MTKKDVSGPAFPRAPGYQDAPGMSLRDYFAGQALVGACAGITEVSQGLTIQLQPADVAQIAYVYADAMLEARNDGRESVMPIDGTERDEKS